MSNTLLNTPSAMAIANSIEQMRHEHLSLERYLGLQKDRQLMEAELTAFYQRNGVLDVTPEMIEKAVAAWKRDRFKFGGWQGSDLSHKLANAYLWFQPRYKQVLSMTAMVSVLIVGGVAGLNMYAGYMVDSHRDRVVSGMQTDQANLQASLEKLNKEITGYQATLTRFAQSKPGSANLLGDKIADVREQLAVLVSLRDDIQNWSKDNLVIDQQAIKQNPAEAQKVWEARTYTYVADFRKELEQARASMSQKLGVVNSLVDTSEQLVQLRNSSLYAAFSGESDVAFKLSRAEMDFTQGRVEEARKGLGQLNQLLQAKQNTKGLQASYDSLVAQVEPIFQDNAGKQKLSLLLAQTQIAVKQGDKAAFSRLSDQISNLADYVATPLHLEIVNKPNIKSGVERKYDSKDGANAARRWYLVVQAVDASGMPRQMDIFDAESQRTARVVKWGQEVSFQGYQKVKQDKVSDGILDDTDVGDKLAGNYAFTYNMPMLTGTITSW